MRQVGEILDEASIDELLDCRVPERLDIHGPPRSEVAQPLLELGLTRGADAAPVRLTRPNPAGAGDACGA